MWRYRMMTAHITLITTISTARGPAIGGQTAMTSVTTTDTVEMGVMMTMARRCACRIAVRRLMVGALVGAVRLRVEMIAGGTGDFLARSLRGSVRRYSP